jgi:nucleotide-binding universal stress UspA family protein
MPMRPDEPGTASRALVRNREMLPYSRVIVGMDFSNGAKNALAHAGRLTPEDPKVIEAVHVVDPAVIDDLSQAIGLSTDAVRADVERSARQEWARVAGTSDFSVPAFRVVFDSAVRGLVGGTARSDLLMVGTRAEAGTGAGIVAAGCARRASCSVMLVDPSHVGPFRRICVGVDFSDLARHALVSAASISAHEGSDLHVVHVFQAPWHRLHYRAPTPEANPEFIRNFSGTLERLLADFTEAAGRIAGPGRVHSHLLDSPKHGPALARLAGEKGADLIVVGAAGRRGLQQMILGSTAERICRDATTSVLVVRPHAQP